MCSDVMLKKIKANMTITHKALDKTLIEQANEVLNFMKEAGVSETILSNNNTAAGVVARGVNDLLTQGNLSEYFFQRVTQLKTGAAND